MVTSLSVPNFVDSILENALITGMPRPRMERLHQLYEGRLRKWHVSTLSFFGYGEDILVKTGQDTDTTVLYQGLAESKAGGMVLVITSELDAIEAQVKPFFICPLLK